MFLISYVPKHKLKSYVKKIMIYKINDIYYTYIPMLTKHNTRHHVLLQERQVHELAGTKCEQTAKPVLHFF
jgi:hypothetical protein